MSNALLEHSYKLLEEIETLRAENAKLRDALLSIVNIALMDTGHWAKTIEQEALNALGGEKK